MNNYLVTVPDFTTVVESTNFIAFDAPAQEREIRRYDQEQAVKAAHREGWDLAMKIWDMTWTERREAFGDNLYSLEDVVACDLDFLAEKYAAWKKKKAEEAAEARNIKAGDVFRNRNSGTKVAVIDITAERDAVMIVNAVGHLYGMMVNTFHGRYAKTGEHIDSNNILYMVDMLKEK